MPLDNEAWRKRRKQTVSSFDFSTVVQSLCGKATLLALSSISVSMKEGKELKEIIQRKLRKWKKGSGRHAPGDEHFQATDLPSFLHEYFTNMHKRSMDASIVPIQLQWGYLNIEILSIGVVEGGRGLHEVRVTRWWGRKKNGARTVRRTTRSKMLS